MVMDQLVTTSHLPNAERLDELAEILAEALLRVQRHRLRLEKKRAFSQDNSLDASRDKSVHVTGPDAKETTWNRPS